MPSWRFAAPAGGGEDDDFPGGEFQILTPMSVWLGSANWTRGAANHIEFGVWTTDKALCSTVLDFMKSVIRASEPLASAAPGPLPELVEADWDDEAFIEYMAEMEPDDYESE
jgi:hypothetical protein